MSGQSTNPPQDVTIIVDKDDRHSRAPWEVGYRVMLDGAPGLDRGVRVGEYDRVGKNTSSTWLRPMNAETARRVAAEMALLAEILEAEDD